MGKVFRPSNRESKILSRIESSKEHARRQAISQIRDCIDPLSNAVAMKLVESGLVETTNKGSLEKEINESLHKLSRADEFDVDFQIAPFRNLVPQPNVVSLFLLAFVVEKLIHHRDVVDIFGQDIDIYHCIHEQVTRFAP